MILRNTSVMRVNVCIAVGAEQVTIDSAPVIQTVAGSSMNLSCVASPSRPPVKVTWHSSLQNEATTTQNEGTWTYSTVLADKKRYNVTSVLMIRANRTDNERVYRCSVINDAMTTPVSAAVQLTVHCKTISFILFN